MFPFIVKLPNKRVYTSIDFGKGSINYILKAAIGNSSSYVIPASPDNASTSSLTKKKILQNPSHTSEKVISLVNPIDVSLLPRPKPKRLFSKIHELAQTKSCLARKRQRQHSTPVSNEHDHSLPEGATPEGSDPQIIKVVPVPTIKAILEVPAAWILAEAS